MILAGRFTDWWAYLIAPLVAGVLAVLVYDQVLAHGQRQPVHDESVSPADSGLG